VGLPEELEEEEAEGQQNKGYHLKLCYNDKICELEAFAHMNGGGHGRINC